MVSSSVSVPVPAPDPVLLGGLRCGADAYVSSDEVDAEVPEEVEKHPYQFSPSHPRPVRVRTALLTSSDLGWGNGVR